MGALATVVAGAVLMMAPSASAPAQPWKNTAAAKTGAALTGLAAFGGTFGLAMLLERHRLAAMQTARQKVDSAYRDRVDPYLDEHPDLRFDFDIIPDAPPRYEIRRAAFRGYPLGVSGGTVALAGLSGALAARARPPNPEHRMALVFAGGATGGIGAIAWLVGRLHKPAERCYEGAIDQAVQDEGVQDRHLDCFGRWYDTHAALMGIGTGMAAVGLAVIMYAEDPLYPRVTPQLALDRQGFTAGATIRF